MRQKCSKSQLVKHCYWGVSGGRFHTKNFTENLLTSCIHSSWLLDVGEQKKNSRSSGRLFTCDSAWADSRERRLPSDILRCHHIMCPSEQASSHSWEEGTLGRGHSRPPAKAVTEHPKKYRRNTRWHVSASCLGVCFL